MQTVTQKDLWPGVHFTAVHTTKFKSSVMSVTLMTQLDRETARRQRSYMLCQCGVAGLSALLWLLSISAVPALEICAVAGALVSGGFLCLILLTSIRAG